MATKPATAPIHKGKPGGMDSASKIPVITAEKSSISPDWPPWRTKKRSVATQLAVTTMIEASADRPYWKM